MPEGVTTLSALVVLVTVHLAARALRLRHAGPRSLWLSFAGGASVAYVFVALLPEVGAGQTRLAASVTGELARVEGHLFIVALVGLLVYYGLHRLALRRVDRADRSLFALHVGANAALNGLIGYLLPARSDAEIVSLALYTVAMGLHLFIIDAALRDHYRRLYDGVGRWVLVACLVGGWALGLVAEVPPLGIDLLRGFLAGGVILQVMQGELPDDRQGRFWAFAAGALGYGGLLLLV